MRRVDAGVAPELLWVSRVRQSAKHLLSLVARVGSSTEAAAGREWEDSGRDSCKSHSLVTLPLRLRRSEIIRLQFSDFDWENSFSLFGDPNGEAFSSSALPRSL